MDGIPKTLSHAGESVVVEIAQLDVINECSHINIMVFSMTGTRWTINHNK
jgi:hypothetical protein